MEGRVSNAWKEVYGQELARLTFNCAEYKIHEPTRRMVARTCWYDYNSGHTNKILATISRACAFAWDSSIAIK
jgi:hypothetical protein